MKGPQGLAGESKERRCQTANTQRLRVRGGFCVRAPEIVRHRKRAANGNWDVWKDAPKALVSSE